MRCQQIDRLLIRYADGELPPAQAEEVRTHLETCSHCQLLLDLTTAETEALRGTDGIPDISPSFTSDIMSLIAREPARRKRFPIWQWTPLAAAAVIAVCLIVPSLDTHPGKPRQVTSAPETRMSIADQKADTAVAPTAGVAAPMPDATEEAETQTQRQKSRVLPTAPEYKRAGVLDGSRSMALTRTAASMSSQPALESTSSEGLKGSGSLILPTWLPEGYVLASASALEGQNTHLVFIDSENTTSPPLTLEASLIQGAVADQVANSETDTTAEKADSAATAFTTIVSIGGRDYRVTVDGPFPTETLLKVAISCIEQK